MDTFGFPLALRVTPADVQDRGGARMLLAILMMAFEWVEIIRTDSAYGCPLENRARSTPWRRKVKMEIMKRFNDLKTLWCCLNDELPAAVYALLRL